MSGCTAPASDILDATVGDTDGDGELEVVLLVGQSYSSSYPTDIIRLDESLQPIGSFTLPWSALTVDIEPSSTARKNLIVGRIVGTSYSYDGAIAIVGARSGGVVFESPTLIGSVQRKSVHYVTLPGETRPRVSIGTANGMYLTR